MGITQIYAQCYTCGTGTNSFWIGTGNNTSGTNSFAGGNLTTASGINSFAFGYLSTASGLRGIALGNETQVFNTDGIAIGSFVTSAAANSYLFGQNLYSNAANSITIGMGTSSSSLLSNSKANSIMFGVTNKPSLTIVQPAGADVGYLGIGTTDPKQKVHLDEGNLLITSVNSGTGNNPAGALLFTNVIDEFVTAQWGIEYLNSTHPVYGGTGLNFRKYLGKFAQGVSPSALFISDNYRVGIGTKEPQAKLDVAGSAVIADNLGVGTNAPVQKLHVENGNILIGSNIHTADFEKKALVFGVTGVQPSPPASKWGIERVGAGSEHGLNFWKYGYYAPAKDGDDTRGMEYRTVMFFDDSDNVGIGTDKPQAKLDVNGTFKAQSANITGKLTANKIRVENMLSAKEIKVELANPWPDYVFGKDYNLMPLQELEQFVNKNQHLPNVPTATSVEANGVNVGEMNAILLQKMEEMTLYIIALQKQIDELKSSKP